MGCATRMRARVGSRKAETDDAIACRRHATRGHYIAFNTELDGRSPHHGWSISISYCFLGRFFHMKRISIFLRISPAADRIEADDASASFLLLRPLTPIFLP